MTKSRLRLNTISWFSFSKIFYTDWTVQITYFLLLPQQVSLSAWLWLLGCLVCFWKVVNLHSMFQETREAKKSKKIRKSAGGMFQNELSLPPLLQNTAFPVPPSPDREDWRDWITWQWLSKCSLFHRAIRFQILNHHLIEEPRSLSQKLKP